MKATIDGYDIYTHILIKYINIWNEPNRREVYKENDIPKSNILGQVKHGKKVKLLDQRKEDCLIKYKGIIGFVKYWWIKELKTNCFNKFEKESKLY
jgi:hypothetical protein